MIAGSGGVPTWLALLPPAAYLLAVACAHLRRRPSTVAGGWDALALSAAIAATVVLGPLELILPAAIGGVWRLVFGTLCFALVAVGVQLATRPRLVIYNASLEQVRPVVAEVAAALDPAARWAGETVALPGRDVQVHLDGRGGLRSVSLVTLGSRTSPEGWAEFSRRVRRAVRSLRVRSSPWAGLFIAVAVALLGIAAWMAWASTDPPGTGVPLPTASRAAPSHRPEPPSHLARVPPARSLACPSTSTSRPTRSPFRS
jgi:hypothetical protein